MDNFAVDDAKEILADAVAAAIEEAGPDTSEEDLIGMIVDEVYAALPDLDFQALGLAEETDETD